MKRILDTRNYPNIESASDDGTPPSYDPVPQTPIMFGLPMRVSALEALPKTEQKHDAYSGSDARIVEADATSPSPISTLDFLLFSELAYDLTSETGLATVPIPAGFQVLPATDNYPSGLTAVAFINKNTNQIVISFRGSVDYTKDWFNADFLHIVPGVTPQAFLDAKMFAQQIEASNKGYTLYVTGHSLGGAEAEYVAANLHLGGTTFAAPGVAALLPTGVSSVDPLLTNFVNQYDPVGNYTLASGTHVGNVVYLPASLSYGSIFAAGVIAGSGVIGATVDLGAAAALFHPIGSYGAALFAAKYISGNPLSSSHGEPIDLGALYPGLQTESISIDVNGNWIETGSLSVPTNGGNASLKVVETAYASGNLNFVNSLTNASGSSVQETLSINALGNVTSDTTTVNGLTVDEPTADPASVNVASSGAILVGVPSQSPGEEVTFVTSGSDGETVLVGGDASSSTQTAVSFASGGGAGDTLRVVDSNSGTIALSIGINSNDSAVITDDSTLANVSSYFDFTGNTGGSLLNFDDLSSFNATVYGAISGDFIEFSGVKGAEITSFPDAENPTFSFKNASGQTGTITFGDWSSNAGFAAGNLLDNGNLAIEVDRSAVCYLAGTMIGCDRGEVAVEALSIGDHVRTYDGTFRPIKWIGRRSYAAVFAANNPDVVPIRIKAGALADGVPVRDLYVSPQHAMLVDNVLVPAKHLVNGITIQSCPEIDPISYFHIELEQHDVIFAEGAPAETFIDCDSRGIFQNAAEFAALYPSHVAPRWEFCAARVESGHLLEDIRARLNARAGIGVDGPPERHQAGALQGHIDLATNDVIAGWAWQADHPEHPARLEVLVGDGIIGQVIANGSRPDVRDAGYGDGRCGFRLELPQPLSPFQRHVVRVRRVADGSELANSGSIVIEAAARLDAATLNGFAHALRATVAGAASDADQDALIRFMANETEALRSNRLRGKRRPSAKRDACPLALFIDDTMPVLGRDAGSNAALDHIRSLQQLGYRVAVAACDMAACAADVRYLEALGITACVPPAVASVEEMLRRLGRDTALVYLHRLETASLYLSMARHYCPRAKVVYSVADLHFVRLARQAQIEGSTALAAESRLVRERELMAAGLADSVITHSDYEAVLLRQLAPKAKVHVVPWSFAPRPRAVPFKERRDVLFLGDFRHSPNGDAARWLAQEVMPEVWRHDSTIKCVIVGSNMPPVVKRLSRKNIVPLGHVANLDGVFDQVRLTVAPLRYGAGLKGKVLDSLAAGLPCVCTPVAAEGLALPSVLQGIVGANADELAERIIRLHADEQLNSICAEAGLHLARKELSAERIDQLMANAVGLARGAFLTHKIDGAVLRAAG